jgi:tRNA (adenine37-N6)-methyltransferase
MPSPKAMEVVFRPIGLIHTRFGEQNGTPIQAAMANDEQGSIEIFPEFQEGLSGLEQFSHLIVLYHLHQIKSWAVRVKPYLDEQEHGLFATRSPKRPNPIGISVVRLDRIAGGTLHFHGADMLDGTPVLDLKPYVPAFDHHPADRVGWIATATHRGKPLVVADSRFVEPPALSPKEGRIVAVCLSPKAGTAKQPVETGEFVAGLGFRDDGHAGTVRQISLLMSEDVDRFKAETGLVPRPGDFAENLQTAGFDLHGLQVGSRLRVGEAELEVTQIGKEASPHHYSFQGHRLLPTKGVFCRVRTGGQVKIGMAITRLTAPNETSPE